MSARLGLNEMPIIPWKGKTLNQITSSIKENNINTIGSATKVAITKNNQFIRNVNYYPSLFLPPPLKLYRREIANTIDISHCYARTSLRIDEFNRPGGSINNVSIKAVNGLVNTLDDTFPNNTCERPGTCSVFLSPSQNAKRRVRSSGMIKKQFDISRDNDSYHTSTNQYLVSRNRTFSQNQYNYIRQGNAASKPGSSQANNNLYSPNGLNHCKKYYVAIDSSFQYVWINSSAYTVSVPAGYYTVTDFNYILQNTMAANYHYYIAASQTVASAINTTINNNYWYNQNIMFLLAISYDALNSVIQLQSTAVSSGITNFSTNFSIPTAATWTTPSSLTAPYISIGSTQIYIQKALGFSTGSYPTTHTANQVTLSNFPPGLHPEYTILYYKPNNPQFGQQGAVTASSLIARKKYDSITNNTAFYAKSYGTATANALAYGVPENGYTKKDQMGYPLIMTPKFANNGNLIKCAYTSTLRINSNK